MTEWHVSTTDNGVRVQRRDTDGLADGLFVKGHTRYFYGENPYEDAVAYARRQAGDDESVRITLPVERRLQDE